LAVIVGSHRKPLAPPSVGGDTSNREPRLISVTAGDVIVFDDRLYHRQIVEEPNAPRLLMTSSYGLANRHAWRHYAHYRFMRHDLGYETWSKNIDGFFQAEQLRPDFLGDNCFAQNGSKRG
jgi:hypothetical protein